MKISIQATRLELTPALREYVEAKLGSVGKLLQHFERAGELTLFVEVARTTKHHRHGEVYYAEVTLRVPRQTIRIEEYDADIREAVDRVKDRLKIDIAKLKERREERRRERRV